MIRKNGFDTDMYLAFQVEEIKNRVSLCDKFYLEFGGKLRYDHHASRVLPGYDVETKVRMLKQLGGISIIHCISAKDIESRKVRRDFGLAYDDQILKDISDLRELGLDVSAVVINRYAGEPSAEKFKQRLENRDVRVFVHYEIPNYLTDLDLVVSDEGYGKPSYVDTEEGIVVVTAPGPGSGKMSFCMSQIFHDRKIDLKSGFAKFETFPIWNLDINHPVNIAYEAATADIGDYNVIDPYHKEAYGVDAVNYNRDVENFAIMRKIIEKLVDEDSPLAGYKSPTDMGVNMAKEGIVNDDVVRKAATDEIIRRYFRYHREYVEGDTTRDTLDRMGKIMEKVGARPEDRYVVLPTREAAEDARRRAHEGKGYKGIFCGAAIELYTDFDKPIIITGKNSPLLHAESAALLNALKIIAGIPDEIDVISPDVTRAITGLRDYMGSSTTSLEVKEVLDALAASSVSDENARRCMGVLDKLRGCEMHTTHLMDEGDEKPLKQLGINVTTDARLALSNYFNK